MWSQRGWSGQLNYADSVMVVIWFEEEMKCVVIGLNRKYGNVVGVQAGLQFVFGGLLVPREPGWKCKWWMKGKLKAAEQSEEDCYSFCDVM